MRERDRERETHRETGKESVFCLEVHSPDAHKGWSWVTSKSNLVHPFGCIDSVTSTIFCCFPRGVSGEQDQKQKARTLPGTYIGCWCCRWELNLLCQMRAPAELILELFLSVTFFFRQCITEDWWVAELVHWQFWKTQGSSGLKWLYIIPISLWEIPQGSHNKILFSLSFLPSGVYIWSILKQVKQKD